MDWNAVVCSTPGMGKSMTYSSITPSTEINSKLYINTIKREGGLNSVPTHTLLLHLQRTLT